MPTTTVSIHLNLDRGERQLWVGQPKQGMVLRASDAYMIPFSFLWAGFAVFWETGVVKSNAPGFFVLWGIPFVLVGLYITIGRFFVDAFMRSRTTYAVTTDRVIITTRAFSTSTKSLNLRTLSDITLTERNDGRGTITFGPTNPLAQRFAGTRWTGASQTPSFEMISDARRVYNLIRDAQRETDERSRAQAAPYTPNL